MCMAILIWDNARNNSKLLSNTNTITPALLTIIVVAVVASFKNWERITL